MGPEKQQRSLEDKYVSKSILDILPQNKTTRPVWS
jgi:hypothetical protein